MINIWVSSLIVYLHRKPQWAILLASPKAAEVDTHLGLSVKRGI